jgi:hypothetical protein
MALRHVFDLRHIFAWNIDPDISRASELARDRGLGLRCSLA